MASNDNPFGYFIICATADFPKKVQPISQSIQVSCPTEVDLTDVDRSGIGNKSMMEKERKVRTGDVLIKAEIAKT